MKFKYKINDTKKMYMLVILCVAFFITAVLFFTGCQSGLLYKVEFNPNRTPGGSFKAETKDGREIKPGSKVPAGTIVYFTAAKDGFEVCSWKITGGTKISGGNVGEKTAAVKIGTDTVVIVEFKEAAAPQKTDSLQQEQQNPPTSESTREGLLKSPANPRIPKISAPQNPENPQKSPAPPADQGIRVKNVTFKLKTKNGNLLNTVDYMPLKLDQQYEIIPAFEPSDATDKTLHYEVKKGGVSVTQQGVLSVLKSGESEIVARASNNVEYTFYFSIKKDHTVTVEGKTATSHDYTAFTETFRLTKQYTGSEYELAVESAEPTQNWLTYEKTGEDTTEETLIFHIAENQSQWERKAVLKFTKKLKEGRRPKTVSIHTATITQMAHPNPQLTTKWVHGITPPEDSDLKTEPGTNPKYRKWEETTTTTWFNARKLFYTEKYKAIDDSKMCWAMSTADLLHWWMWENKANIDKYMAKKGISTSNPSYKYYVPEYKGGLGEAGEKDKSSIATAFREGFKNDGLQLNTAVRWYLYGDKVSDTLQKNSSPGILAEVLKDVPLDDLIQQRYVHNRQEFKSRIQDALDNDNALAVILEPKGNIPDKLHVVTVWGVEFDGDKNIVALWTSDSNDRNSHIVKFGVHYRNGQPCKINYGAPNDQGDTKITDVIVMKNAKKEFKTWLDTH